jgi:hypothetical protein
VLLFLLVLPYHAAAGTIVVKPGKLDRFVLSAPESAVAGESFLVRVEPFDASGNLITDPPPKGSTFAIQATGSAEVFPDRIRPSDFAGGITVRVTDKVAERIEISVLETGAQTPLATASVPVYPNKLDHFSLNVPKNATSGASFQARVIARDAFGNTKLDLPDIRDSLKLAFSGAGTISDSKKPLPPFRSGEMILSLEPLKVGKVAVVVEELTTHARGESAEIVIAPGPVQHFVVQGPKAAVAGEDFTLHVSAMDRNENVVTGFGTQGEGVELIPSGEGYLTPAAVTAKEFRKGQARVKATYTAAGTFTVTAREMNGDLSGKSEKITIMSADPDHFIVRTPEEAVAGETFPVEIEALDRFNNTIVDYDLRGLEVYLSTDGSGNISPAAVSPASFKDGKATVDISYDRAESFSVIAALSKDDLEKIIRERSRRAPVEPPSPALTPEEVLMERERESALEAREAALRAREQTGSAQEEARQEALRAREEARKVLEEASKTVDEPPPPPPPKPAPAPSPQPPPPAPVPTPAPAPKPATPERVELPPVEKAPVQVARRSVQELSQVSLIESKGQAMVMLETTGPVSYNASTGSEMSKEWIFVELFPAERNTGKVADLVRVESDLVGDIMVEDLGGEKLKISLQVLPPGISYVVSQQDRAVVVKIIKNE